MRPHGSQEQLERRRRRAIDLLKQGLEPWQVAAKIGCALSSVYLWREVVRKKGEAGLKAKPVPGRPPKLTQSQKRRLTRMLLKGALSCGYSTDLWTQRESCWAWAGAARSRRSGRGNGTSRPSPIGSGTGGRI